MKEKKPIKIGVVGCGAIAQIMHLPNIRQLDSRFDLKSICDVSPKLLEAIGDRYEVGINFRYTDYTAFLDSDIDAVFVLTAGSHAPFVLQALRAGKHVLCEKPLCFTLAEANEIEATLASSNKKLMIGYMKRFDSGFKHFIQTAQQIEKPRYTQVTVLHPEEQQYFDMHGVEQFNDVPATVKESFNQEQDNITRVAVGDISKNLKHVYQDALLSSLVHNINCIRAIFGKPRGVLSTNIWPLDSFFPTINTVLDYGNAHHVVLTWSYLSEVRHYVEELSIYSDTERLKANFSSPFLKSTPTIISHEYMKEGRYINKQTQASFINAFQTELVEFYDCVLNNKIVETDLKDAKEDIEILQAVLAANQPAGLGGEALLTQFCSYKRAA